MPVFNPEKVTQLRESADKLEAQATEKMAEFNKYRSDIAWLTQPANPNSPFAKRRQKAVDRYGEGLRLMGTVKKLRERADRYERSGMRTAGDAEAARQAERDAADQLIGKGSTVKHAVFGTGVVQRVNRKTFSVEIVYPWGARTMALDKSQCQLVDGSPA